MASSWKQRKENKNLVDSPKRENRRETIQQIYNSSDDTSAIIQNRYAWAICGAMVILIVAAYHNSFHAPFVFDDIEAIVDNPSIRNLKDIGRVLSPPLSATGAVGRPIVNLSFAVNYAVSGTDVFGYHITNLLIHICAALVLFGVIRRTMQLNKPPSTSQRTLTIAGFVALLWSVHPLLTESVTSAVQRSESLMGLFFLLTLYCFIRSVDSSRRLSWRIGAVLFCFLGAATKEVMAVCPVLVFLYDRTFVAKTFLNAWKASRGLYIALFSSWWMVFYLALGTIGRNQTVGFGYGVAWWEYLLTQCYGVANYLILSFWPQELVFDYGTVVITDPIKVIPGALVLSVLLGTTIRGLFRRSVVGFLGACFFLILAPSSSILPLTTQTLAEHRMYLPLISVVILFVSLLERLKQKGILVAGLLTPMLIMATINRNADYRDPLKLWRDTAAKMPDNPRAHNDLANALANLGDHEAALHHYQQAVFLNPKSALTYFNMAGTLVALGRTAEAEAAYIAAISRNPAYAKAHNDLGTILMNINRQRTALVHFKKAAALAPENVLYLMNAGNSLMALGQWKEAQSYFQLILDRAPDNIDAVKNLGGSLMQLGKIDEAEKIYQQSIVRHPDNSSLRYNLGRILAQKGNLNAAVEAYQAALRIDPRYPEALYNIGNIRLEQQRYSEAVNAYYSAIAIKPDYIAAINNLGGAYKRMGEINKAKAQYEKVLRLKKDHERARRSLDELLLYQD